MNREEGMIILQKNLPNDSLIKHCIAVGAVMEELAVHFGEDKEKWFLAGLLHDIDYEITKTKPEKHGIIAMEILADCKLSNDILQAIKAHSGNFPAETLFDKALLIADPITGLITASALINPAKKVSAVKLKSLKKKFKNKKFAAGANREQIADCEKIGLQLNDFLELSLKAMVAYQDQLGLGD